MAQAGRSGAVTIATNMAGRGTDILLGGNPSGYLDTILRKHAEQVSYIRDMPEHDDDERAEKEEAIQQYIENMTEDELRASIMEDLQILESLIERFLIQVSQVFMLRVFDCRTMS